jgi:molybdopterin/thiamine biosynthesis adenylyltransferase
MTQGGFMSPVINIMRHESVFDPNQHPYPIHIIGVGATGSHVFASLVGLGCKNISVYDYDVVEEHNLANQIYMGSDVGSPKVDACKRYYCNKLGISEDKIPVTMQFNNVRVTQSFVSESSFSGIVFLLTDTMTSRRLLFNALTSGHTSGEFHPDRSGSTLATALIIETRMGATHGNIYTVNPYSTEQRNAWLSTLVDDENEDLIEVSPCGTALSVGPTASLIANYAVWQMMQFFVDPLALQQRVDVFFKPTLTITSPALAA